MVSIRPAGPADRADLYRVCLQTGAAGQDASHLYEDADLLGQVYAGAYLAMPDTMAFVACDDRGVAGYVLAALDTAAFEAACERSWWPPLRAAHPLPVGRFAGAADTEAADTGDAALVELIHEPPVTPTWIVDRWPAHLHIDLLPRLQGSGMGRTLMATMLDALRDRDVPGVHLGVAAANERAIGFYRHLGFVEVAATDEAVTMGLLLRPA
ncbi:MAG TPA: GNAT family N-acetyltransferase [Nitriliruptoraceae bacterium]|nr:GNAT family N-acetyltransferase [Nitriliruptoraceae bacterium]